MDKNELVKNDEGNIIGCKHCGSRNIRKDGWSYYSNNGTVTIVIENLRIPEC